MREPSKQLKQRTYGKLLPIVRSREAARASIILSAPLTTGGRQARPSRAIDQRAKSSITPEEAAPTC